MVRCARHRQEKGREERRITQAPHPQQSRIRAHHPAPKRPPERVCRPPPRADEIPVLTHIRDRRVGHLAIPLVLDLGDLVAGSVDQDLGVDGRLLAQTLDFVEGRHVQLDRVAGGDDFVVLALDGGEGCLEAVLRLVSTSQLRRGRTQRTHCASYCFLPSAIVMGSWKTPSSAQSWSLASDGRPAKRSRTEPTMVRWSLLRSTPAAVLMSVDSILSSPTSLPDVEDILNCWIGAVRVVWAEARRVNAVREGVAVRGREASICMEE